MLENLLEEVYLAHDRLNSFFGIEEWSGFHYYFHYNLTSLKWSENNGCIEWIDEDNEYHHTDGAYGSKWTSIDGKYIATVHNTDNDLILLVLKVENEVDEIEHKEEE